MRNRNVLIDYLGMLLVLAGLIVFFSLKTDYFFTKGTFQTIANQIPDAVILAVGMTFVLIIAGIDLSVGSVLGFSGAVMCVCLVQKGFPLPLAIAAGLGAGLICGLLNGLVVIAWGIPSFIVTLGMLEIARGGAQMVTDSGTIYLGGRLDFLQSGSLFGFTLSFAIALVVVVAGQILLTQTTFGRHMLAIGANEESARLSGINTRSLKLTVFAISGALAGLTGLIQCSRLDSANPNSGTGAELQAIAAVVIGGTSLMGGRGSVVKTFIGVLIIAVLENGLTHLEVEDYTKRIVTGMVIVIAVVIDYYRHRLQKGK